MEIQIQRENLLKPLQAVMGVVERRQTMPILANVCLAVKEQQLSITASDLEVELQARVNLESPLNFVGEITIPGKKFMDICRSLPEQSAMTLIQEKDKMIVRSGKSRFSLSTLPADDFPLVKNIKQGSVEFAINQKDLRYLIQRTHFAMAQEDVRYYLNGMLLEINNGMIKTVATDGHRLALNALALPVMNTAFMQVILPRKGVLELMRLLEDSDAEVTIQISQNHVCVKGDDFTYISKLVDGRFPDYDKVIPKNGDKIVILERDILKQALLRVAILSNEKIRGVCLQLQENVLRIFANNPELEEARRGNCFKL